MDLHRFLKGLFNQPAVEGYEIGRVEVDVLAQEQTDGKDIYEVKGSSPYVYAKVVIVPKDEDE